MNKQPKNGDGGVQGNLMERSRQNKLVYGFGVKIEVFKMIRRKDQLDSYLRKNAANPASTKITHTDKVQSGRFPRK